MMQLRAEHLSAAAGGALDVLKGALSGAASSLTLPHVSVRVRASLLSAHQLQRWKLKRRWPGVCLFGQHDISMTVPLAG
jgi:hypothetical protein